MSKYVVITLTSVGSGNGNSFNLFSDVDTYATPFESNVLKSDLLTGYTSYLVPDSALKIKVQSVLGGCGLQPVDGITIQPIAPTPTPSVTPSITPTLSVTPTNTVTPSVTSSPGTSLTPTPSITPTNTITPTTSITPTPSTTLPATPTPTPTPTAQPTSTPTAQPTPSITPTMTVTPTTSTPCYGFNLTPVYDTTCDRSGDDVTAYKTTGGSLEIGDILRNSCGGTTLATGFYSDGSYRYVVNVGEITNKIACVSPSPTPTRTVTPTPSITPTPEPMVWNLYYPCGTTTPATQVIAYTSSFLGGEIIKGSNGLCYTVAITGYSLQAPITVVSEHSTCNECDPPSPTPSPSPCLTYYELAECSPGTGYAFTLIVPNLGVNQRYVLPSPETFYLYTGASSVQCTPPAGYNASIQKTTFTNCP